MNNLTLADLLLFILIVVTFAGLFFAVGVGVGREWGRASGQNEVYTGMFAHYSDVAGELG